MTMVRLRPRWSDDELHKIYATPHDHRIYGRGHAERVEAMIKLAAGHWQSAADLSCGNGIVLNSLDVTERHFGDFAPGWPLVGPIEYTIDLIPPVELFILGETLEHLDDPAGMLVEIDACAQYLLLSTPIDNWNDSNAEHYWSWSREDVEVMLVSSGFTAIKAFTTVDSRTYGEPYCYGIWLCESE